MHVDIRLHSRRDTRIDVFRALALLTIFINHVPGTIFESITYKHFGFSDSTEAFVLISGISVGLAYGAKYHVDNRLMLTLKMWRRAFVLYSAHILTTFATLSIFCGAAIFMHCPEFLSRININPVINEPAKALFGIVVLGHQLGYNNILPLYMVLMFIVPLMLYLASKNLKLLLMLSGALYFFAGVYQLAPPNYPTKGLWFLNPLSWQFLFVIGLATMIYIRQGGDLPRHPLLLIAAIAYLVMSLVWVRCGFWWIDTSMGFPRTLTGFNKTFVSLPRLVHILALAYVIAIIPAISDRMRFSVYHPLAILGKYSLPVFIAGTILAMMAQILKKVNPGGIPYDTLLIATGIVVQFALAYYLEWLGMIGWRNRQVVPTVSADVVILAGSLNLGNTARVGEKALDGANG
ncbi:MAG: hypothetical protein JSC189_000575 [Candidatus Tokpelaia sp. JSC189]|nr:MAG: hypothetical protein JSC189_000575 [Candidatus Tokpelaia sp. JSC189]